MAVPDKLKHREAKTTRDESAPRARSQCRMKEQGSERDGEGFTAGREKKENDDENGAVSVNYKDGAVARNKASGVGWD